MFGTSGIRGIYKDEIDEEFVLSVARIFADSHVVLGRDTRKSSPTITRAIEAGVLSRGKDVVSLGIVPTPTVALATIKHKTGGIMVTASHNPEEYNGIKLLENGKELSRQREKEVGETFRSGFKGAVKTGGRVFEDGDILNDHASLIISLVDREIIAKKKPKVIVDCNGAAAVISPLVLRRLGCYVTSINASLEGFSRASEPTEKNLHYLKELVPELGADFAVAHDGDGDRCVIFDENGEILGQDIQLSMMIEHELSKSENRGIVTTTEASLIVRETIAKNSGKAEITPVGSRHVAEKMEETDALFGGEPCGEYMFKGGVGVPDGPLTAAKFAELFCMGGKLSELRKKYPAYPMVRKKFHAQKKHESIEKIRNGIKTNGEINAEDGIRVDEGDGWFLIRASGTEPVVRLTVEYRSKEKLKEKVRELEELIKKFL